MQKCSKIKQIQTFTNKLTECACVHWYWKDKGLSIFLFLTTIVIECNLFSYFDCNTFCYLNYVKKSHKEFKFFRLFYYYINTHVTKMRCAIAKTSKTCSIQTAIKTSDFLDYWPNILGFIFNFEFYTQTSDSIELLSVSSL